MKEFDISVIVLTYNPNYKKLFNTLKSIINQKECKLEIIISDDGSTQFDKQLIVKWMQQNDFNNYLVLDNKINRGTVINVYNSMKLAKGKYVKLISPGDYLYCNSTLKDVINYMKENEYRISFGKAVYYYNNCDEITILNRRNPRDLTPYINNNYKKVKKDYLYYQDYILGAAIICETDLFYSYILKIKDNVKYAEDCAYIMMIADGINIHFWDDYLIWYECNTGISTSGSAEWTKKIKLDNSQCFKIIAKEHPDYKNVCKIHYFEKYNKNLIFRLKFKCREMLLKIKNKNKSENYKMNELKKIIEE
ncbi:MAG: glycosyltransferase family 2 protein [Clostridia bacterium]|nr:glycosyltransferase family 2 protein [Clostridia bacterium]